MKKIVLFLGALLFCAHSLFAQCIDVSKICTACMCTMEYAPVIGCNGVTYPNACAAKNSGVVSYVPAGSDITPGNGDPIIIVIPPVDTTSNPPTNSCIDETKICSTCACTTEYNPVVGCDGKTYSNACEAKNHGVISYKPIETVIDPIDSSGVVEPPVDTVVTNPSDNCIDSSKICNTCMCPALYAPVLGCDGKTYSNACEAINSGVISFKNIGVNTDTISNKFQSNSVVVYIVNILPESVKNVLVANDLKSVVIIFDRPLTAADLTKMPIVITLDNASLKANDVVEIESLSIDPTDNTKLICTFKSALVANSGIVVNIYDSGLSFENTALKGLEIQKNTIGIYPIPTKDVLKIKSNVDINEIQIISASGKQVLKINELSKIKSTIDISTLPSGMYNVVCKMNNKIVFQQSFVKE